MNLQDKILDADIRSIDNNDIITIKNAFSEKAVGFIYDLVYGSAGSIPNPYYGDFSSNSLFCRKWYSQIEDLRKQVIDKYDRSPPSTLALQ